jgi:hypothetical protein
MYSNNKHIMLRRVFLSLLALFVISGGVWLSNINDTQARYEHGGVIDHFNDRNRIVGWAYDPRNPSDEVAVKVLIENTGQTTTVPTTQPRRDVQNRYGTPLHSGFVYKVPNRLLQGQNVTLRMYAKNVRTGGEVELSNSPYRFSKYDPGVTGFVDGADRGMVSGWVFDNAHREKPVAVMVFRGDFRSGELLGTATADKQRSDVAQAYETSGNHGFSIDLDLSDYAAGDTVGINTYAVDRTRGIVKLIDTRGYTVQSTDIR